MGPVYRRWNAGGGLDLYSVVHGRQTVRFMWGLAVPNTIAFMIGIISFRGNEVCR